MSSIAPCLWFDTEGEEAAEFYTRVFPDSRITHVSRYGEAGPGPEGSAMVVAFELDGRRFLALNGGPAHAGFSETVSFEVRCDSQEEVDAYWAALTDGGEESLCGWLKDRFGLSWQIVPNRLIELLGDDDPAVAQSVMQAMLAMRKIEVADLEAAADRARVAA